MSDVTTYKVPDGPLRLAGPVVRPKQGTLPLRGDLAHIALAGRYLAAHYVIPKLRNIGDAPVDMHLAAMAMARGSSNRVLGRCRARLTERSAAPPA